MLRLTPYVRAKMTITLTCRNRRCRKRFGVSAYEAHPALTCVPGQVTCPHCNNVSSADPAYIYLSRPMPDGDAGIYFAEKKAA